MTTGYRQRRLFYTNRRDGTFSEIGAALGHRDLSAVARRTNRSVEQDRSGIRARLAVERDRHDPAHQLGDVQRVSPLVQGH